MQLVLAADASASIDEGEHRLQRQGYAQALRDPRVIHAIEAGDNRAIAVTYVEWTGEEMQAVIVPWTVIRDAESAERVAQQLLTQPRSLREGGTAVGEAIFYAASLFERSGFESERKVIDVSGDGETNRGRPAAMGRDLAAARASRSTACRS